MKILITLVVLVVLIITAPFFLIGSLISLALASPGNPFPPIPGPGSTCSSTPTATTQTESLACQAVQWALLMSAHLHGNPPCLQCSPDTFYDSDFPQAIIAYGQRTCPGCSAWQNGQFQCVVYVLAAYGLVHPFPMAGNADQWWGEYSHQQNYEEIPASAAPAGMRGLPAPGDIMAWNGGAFGHVSVVLSVVPPNAGRSGSVTFGNANGQHPVQTLPLLPNLIVDTANGYWNAFTVEGYIRLK